MFAFVRRIRLGPERGGPEGRRRIPAGSLTTARSCFVLSCLSSPLIPAAPLKNTPLRDGGGENKRMSPEEERSLTNSKRLRMPEFALSFIFQRESRRGWWPETRPPLAPLLLYCWRCQALLAGVASRATAADGARTALNGAGGGTGPPPRGRSICWKWGGASASRDGRS